jgi:hypothetical protein
MVLATTPDLCVRGYPPLQSAQGWGTLIRGDSSKNKGWATRQSLNVSGPSSLDELVCLPESFPVIDEYNQGRWGIFPLIP